MFHRIDDMYILDAAMWLKRVAMLPAYSGAYALMVSQQAAPPALPDYEAMALNPDVENTPDDVVQARFRGLLADAFPEHAAEGFKQVSADEMDRLVK